MSTPKYKVGDYITKPGFLFLEITRVIGSDMPVYYLNRYKTDANAKLEERDGIWQTEYFLEEAGFAKQAPDFNKWQAIQEGDMLMHREQGFRHVVLARVGQKILLSAKPVTRQEVKEREDLEAQLKELTDEMEERPDAPIHIKQLAVAVKKATSEDDMEKLFRRIMTGRNAYKVAGSWYTITEVALSNWELLKE